MKAIGYDRFGSTDVLELRETPKPSVGPGKVLVRVRAASANPYDWHFMRGTPYIARVAAMSLRKPKYPLMGSDLAGEVEAVGGAVTRFRIGDAVYGGVDAGSFAEYVAAPEDRLAQKPTNLSFEEMATVPLAGMTALQGLRDAGRIRPGQKVLIVGAAGGVGTFAVQLAKWYGAEVTGVCSTRNLGLVRSLGADHVIDYTKQDVTRNGRRYDLIFQVAGMTTPAAYRRILTPKGTLVMSSGDSPGRIIGPVGRLFKAALLSPFVSQSLRSFLMKPKSADLEVLSKLIETGTIRPVIDRTFPLSQSADAIRYIEAGHARGKVVIAVSEDTGRTQVMAQQPNVVQEAKGVAR